MSGCEEAGVGVVRRIKEALWESVVQCRRDKAIQDGTLPWVGLHTAHQLLVSSVCLPLPVFLIRKEAQKACLPGSLGVWGAPRSRLGGVPFWQQLFRLYFCRRYIPHGLWWEAGNITEDSMGTIWASWSLLPMPSRMCGRYPVGLPSCCRFWKPRAQVTGWDSNPGSLALKPVPFPLSQAASV